ncbi:methyl-accepting chemotaxis domain-containing protein [Bacillus pumilus]|uniref:hypothetical protein n=1 Tax=Bacillus pumilus TaxID=1408 RepID=UPI0011A06162|nr:hypothetical protein [Bacillus pumilus]
MGGKKELEIEEREMKEIDGRMRKIEREIKGLEEMGKEIEEMLGIVRGIGEERNLLWLKG